MLSSHLEPVIPHEPSDTICQCLASADVLIEDGKITGIDLRSVRPDTLLTVQTRNTTYRVVALGEGPVNASVQGGSYFRNPTHVRVEGATVGGGPIKIGWICVGLRLEIWIGARRVVTSTVRSISVEPCAPTESRWEREHEGDESRRVQVERSH